VDGSAVSLPFDVLGIVSSHNTVKNLHVLAPSPFNGVWGISITTTPAVATTVMDNTIAHNNVSGLIAVGAGFDEFNNGQWINGVTIKHTLVQDNTVSGSVIGILAENVGDHNVITDLTLAGNAVSGVTGLPSILVNGGHSEFNNIGATDNLLDVTIKDNLITGNSNPGDTAGIAILGGSSSPSNNQVTARILNNTITDNTGRGISATAGVFGGSDNQIDVTVRNNLITGNSLPGGTVGISVLGGFASSDNHVTASLLDNTISDNIGHGISAISALDNSSNNDVDVTIRDNTLEKNAGVGIVTYGALGAFSFPSGDSSGNSLNARIERNTVKNASLFGLWVFGGLGSFGSDDANVANGNEVHAIVTDNTITGTAGEGMNLEAGSSGEANDNEVDVTVRKNTVCGSTEANIHAIGGLSSLVFPFFPDNTGTGNTLEGEIAKNTASTVVVEDGVTGNTAHVTQSKNVSCP
jgi:hypothetical protein